MATTPPDRHSDPHRDEPQLPVTDRPVLTAACDARDALAKSGVDRLWQLSEDELDESLRVLAQLHASTEAHLVAVLAEATSRGVGAGDGWGPHDWARMRAPRMNTRTLNDLEKVASAVAEPRLSEVIGAVVEGADPEATEALELSRAGQLVRFHEKVRGMAEPSVLADQLSTLVQAGRGTLGLSERELAVCVKHTAQLMETDRLVEHDAAVHRAHRSLTKRQGPMGMWHYSLVLDDEGSAHVDAAVDALSKPLPDTETGERDERTPAARRADALLELVRAAVGAENTRMHAKTTVVVTIGLDELQGRCRGAGLTMDNHLLTPDTVRRLACDAEIIPAVLGGAGEIVELGRAVRLFTPGQMRQMWLRDKGCTFPGCTRKAKWCIGHHLIHWADGGPTDVASGALLCESHHTVVHLHRYAGRLADGPNGPIVVWDLTPGSYDDYLEEWRRNRPRADASTGEGPPRP